MSTFKKIVIVGGGFAGWYTAATLQHNIKGVEILLIDSDKHPTLGVGETAGWDAPLNFERLCGFKDDREFIYETGAVYKFGVRGINFFNDNSIAAWGKFLNLKSSALCGFYNGFDYPDFDEPWNRDPSDIGMVSAWIRMNRGKKNYKDFCMEVGELEHFLTNTYAPYNKNNKYILRSAPGHAYGFHIDANRFGLFIKKLVTGRNKGEFNQITSAVVDVLLNNDGSVKNIVLENNQSISGDLFIDASGMQRALMSRSTNNSWTASGEKYCNAAWVCPTKYTDPKNELIGATEFHGEEWGWRFRIGLYHRMGNGYVFNTNLVDKDIPLNRLLEITEGKRLHDPKIIRWTPGEYKNPWQNNLIPLGLAQGFVDPYDGVTFEAQSRALDDLVKILKMPYIDSDQIAEYNRQRQLTQEERNLRLDITFGISQRSGPFWQTRRELAVEKNCFQNLKDIILERRSDLESRLTWHWHHQYIRSALAAGVDMSDWEFPPIPEKDVEMIQAFFNYNRQRNQYISKQNWPYYSDWLKTNRFNGETNQEVLARINPNLIS